MGSPPLKLLKKWGYKVRLYSSAQLKYYDMEDLLFGKGQTLLDTRHTFHHATHTSAAESDAKAVAQWKKDLAENPDLREGQMVIFFLDSTHFNYSWPHELETEVPSHLERGRLFHILPIPLPNRKNQEPLSQFGQLHRHLFGKFYKDLADKENAVVIVTGDHGEEFFEHGHLFHNSHLTHEQTNIPLYMKFGQRKEKKVPAVVSQMDIFPTLLHHLSGKAGHLPRREIDLQQRPLALCCHQPIQRRAISL